MFHFLWSSVSTRISSRKPIKLLKVISCPLSFDVYYSLILYGVGVYLLEMLFSILKGYI